MRSYLVVANQTFASPTLAEAIAERMRAGDAVFHVVVPATPIGHGLTWDERESHAAAEARLGELLDRFALIGARATGEVGSKDPVAAVQDAMRARRIDEVILSTLPAGISRWLGTDVPSRLRGSIRVPLTVVTAPREPARQET